MGIHVHSFNVYYRRYRKILFHTKHRTDLLDAGAIKTTLTTSLEGFTVANFKKTHEMSESRKTIGKTVIQF